MNEFCMGFIMNAVLLNNLDFAAFGGKGRGASFSDPKQNVAVGIRSNRAAQTTISSSKNAFFKMGHKKPMISIEWNSREFTPWNSV